MLVGPASMFRARSGVPALVMKRRFQVTIVKKGELFRAHAQKIPRVEAVAATKEDALKKLKATLTEKLGPGENPEE
jgi:hypothetical protein